MLHVFYLDYLTQQTVYVLPWPEVSSDLSSIEHVWNEMERPLRLLQKRASDVSANESAIDPYLEQYLTSIY